MWTAWWDVGPRDSPFPAGNGPWIHKKDLWKPRDGEEATRRTEEMYNGGSRDPPWGTECPPSPWPSRSPDHHILWFIILSRLIRSHSGQGRTPLWMTGVLMESHKDIVTEKASKVQWDPLMIFGWVHHALLSPSLVRMLHMLPMCTSVTAEQSASWSSGYKHSLCYTL